MGAKFGGRTTLNESSAIEAIYDAAFRPEGWPEIVELVRTQINASNGWLISIYTGPKDGVLWTTHAISPDAFQEYADYYCLQDPWTRVAQSMPNVWQAHGSVILPERYVDRQTFGRSEFYNDFCRSVGIEGLCAVLLTDDSRPWIPRLCLSLVRPPGSDPFSSTDDTQLRWFAPHLVRAAELHWRLRQAGGEQQASIAVLDRLPIGVVLLDAGARVLHLNATAERFVLHGRGLRVKNRCLAAMHPAQTTELDQLLWRAVATATGRGIAAGGEMVLSDPDHRRSLEVLACPLPGQHPLSDGTRRAAAIVFVTEPGSQVRLSESVLQQLFGLTGAEAQVALGIANGMTPDEIADERHTDRETVRSQVKTAMDKTGSRRQAELARLLLLSPR